MKINGTKKPTESHAPCLTKGCTNYFNVNYKDANGYCKGCNKILNNENHKKWKTILEDNIKELGEDFEK